VEEKEQIEFRSILEKLLKDPDNKKCADCGTAAPRWGSASLGVFLCIKCSGVHRSMGTHISFIRSVSLDRWKPEEIALIQSMGNANAALVWEAKLPAEYRRPSPNDSISLEKFIRDKYEHKRYYKPPFVEKGSVTSQPVKQEISPGTSASNHTVVLQPPNRTNPPSSSGRNTPQRTHPTPPSGAPLLVDPFLAVNNKSTSTSTPLPHPFPQSDSSQSASLFDSDFPGPQAQNTKPPEPTQPAVDVTLLKKSNIMSMFDVKTEQQKQQQQQQHQQMLLQQQMYFSGSPQLYYTTSGGLIPVMYSPQSYGTAVYPQHY